MASGVKFDLRFETCSLNYHDSMAFKSPNLTNEYEEENYDQLPCVSSPQGNNRNRKISKINSKIPSSPLPMDMRNSCSLFSGERNGRGLTLLHLFIFVSLI